jgi:hypothetical protein
MNALELGLVVLSLLPLPPILRHLHPKIGLGVGILLTLVSAAIAVTLFLLWQSFQRPLLAYLDGILYALLALLAILLMIVSHLTAKQAQANPDADGSPRVP